MTPPTEGIGRVALDDITPSLLARIDVLAALSPSELREVRPLVHVRSYPRGKVIVADQDPTTDLMMILEGRVSVTTFGEGGREVSFRNLAAGASFGELAAIDLQPRSATVIALDATTIGTMTAADYRAALRRYPSMVDATLLQLVRYVRSLSKRIADLAYTVEVRVCAELESLARDTGTAGGRIVLRPSPRRGEIASRINTTREQVSRTISQLDSEGIVVKGKGEMVIPDLARLVAWRRAAMKDR
jgi:CRP/FNR family cyclic AMP-dependent transcriptional regulator